MQAEKHKSTFIDDLKTYLHTIGPIVVICELVLLLFGFIEKNEYIGVVIVVCVLIVSFIITRNLINANIENDNEKFPEPSARLKKIQLGKYILTENNFRKACILGGIIAGLIGAIIIFISFKINSSNWTGYDNIDVHKFQSKVIILIFLLQPILGFCFGYLLSVISWPSPNASKRMKSFRFRILIFFFGFILMIILRQLMTRDAWVCPLHYKETDGRMGGGPLGEPDFETLATAFAGGSAFLILSYTLLRAFQLPYKRIKLSLNRTMLEIAGLSALLALFAWISVFILYKILENLGLIPDKTIIPTWVFNFEFPHPERAMFICLMSFIYILSTLLSIRFFPKSKAKLEFE